MGFGVFLVWSLRGNVKTPETHRNENKEKAFFCDEVAKNAKGKPDSKFGWAAMIGMRIYNLVFVSIV